MDSNHSKQCVAFLRGINVGGHHKIPMKELTLAMEQWGYTQISTLLNSGNIIFHHRSIDSNQLEDELEKHLQITYGFPVPVIIRDSCELMALLALDPFNQIELTKDLRFYVSFLKHRPSIHFDLPWESGDSSFRIINIVDKAVISFLDVSKITTPNSMIILEKAFGKEITTRNWNTIIKIADKLKV